MKAVIQRVSEAKVMVNHKVVGEINQGLLVLLGIADADDKKQLEWLGNKILQMRIFSDDNGLMNKSVLDIGGNILLISQFTLLSSTKKGNRPSFTDAAKQPYAEEWYEQMKRFLSERLGKKIECGIFGADMKVHLVNDGPVTITIDAAAPQ